MFLDSLRIVDLPLVLKLFWRSAGIAHQHNIVISTTALNIAIIMGMFIVIIIGSFVVIIIGTIRFPFMLLLIFPAARLDPG